MFIVLVTGISLWLIYGILTSDWQLVAANSITLILASTILYFNVRHA